MQIINHTKHENILLHHLNRQIDNHDVWGKEIWSAASLLSTDIFQGSHDHRSYERNLSNCVYKPEKIKTLKGFEPVSSRYRCDALTNWAMKLWVLMSPWRMDVKWYMKCFIYWTVDLKSSKLWSSQLISNLQFNIWNISYITSLTFLLHLIWGYIQMAFRKNSDPRRLTLKDPSEFLTLITSAQNLNSF